MKPSTRPYSRHSREVARVLGLMIHNARIERKMTIEQLAERAGVSRGLVQRAEQGDMGCAIGAVLEMATIVGVPLFTADHSVMNFYTRNLEKTFALLPSTVHTSKKVVKDDF